MRTIMKIVLLTALLTGCARRPTAFETGRPGSKFEITPAMRAQALERLHSHYKIQQKKRDSQWTK